MVTITVEEFKRVLQSCGCSPSQASRHHPLLTRWLHESGIADKQELAMFLANILHESGGLQYVREISPHPTAYKHDGRDYYGRGFIQLTHHYNYRDASMALYGDDRLLKNPDQVADDLDVAWRTALWFWKDRVHKRRAGKLASGNFDASIREINSGELSSSASSTQQKQVQKRRQNYENIRKVLQLNGNVATSAPAATKPGGAGAGGVVYVVQQGDTLYKIASKHGTTVQRIAADNGIANPDVIHPGQRFVINQ